VSGAKLTAFYAFFHLDQEETNRLSPGETHGEFRLDQTVEVENPARGDPPGILVGFIKETFRILTGSIVPSAHVESLFSEEPSGDPSAEFPVLAFLVVTVEVVQSDVSHVVQEDTDEFPGAWEAFIENEPRDGYEEGMNG
jgi:hypothetical protein